MKTHFTFILLSIIISLPFVSSCEKGKKQLNLYENMNIDPNVIGIWGRYMGAIRGEGNSITLMYDTISFSSNNQGSIKLYEFSDLLSDGEFYYYTESDIIYLKFITYNKDEEWGYSILNDSLTIDKLGTYSR